jgi:predicted nuclease of predicted toxin-antitoxin system
MRPLGFPLLCDENIHPEVVTALAAQGKDVRAAVAEGLGGRPDEAILRFAHHRGRVVLTHDADFGVLAVRDGVPYVGIVYLRPGHISPVFVLDMLAAIESAPITDVTPPFMIVAERRGETVRIRIRPGTSGS